MPNSITCKKSQSPFPLLTEHREVPISFSCGRRPAGGNPQEFWTRGQRIALPAVDFAIFTCSPPLVTNCYQYTDPGGWTAWLTGEPCPRIEPRLSDCVPDALNTTQMWLTAAVDMHIAANIFIFIAPCELCDCLTIFLSGVAVLC